MFTACLSLPQSPREAELLAENLEALARALREWTDDEWKRASAANAEMVGEENVFSRLVKRTAPFAAEPRQRQRALESAEEVAGVLRVLWPEQAGIAEMTEYRLRPEQGLLVV
jgi:hypothetical protein